MAKVLVHVCDRCKQQIKYFGWTALIRGPRSFHIRKLLNGNPDGYSYTDYPIELCNNCTKALDRFLEEVSNAVPDR